MEVIQPLINEHIVRQTEASLLPPIDATIVEVLRPQEHIHEHTCGADTGINHVSDQRENSGMNSRARGADSGTPVPQVEAKIAEVFQVLSQQCIHEPHRGPVLPKKCRRRKRQKGNLCSHPEEELLKRRWHALQTVPQDDTMKERQAEVLFRRNLEMFEFLMRHEGLL